MEHEEQNNKQLNISIVTNTDEDCEENDNQQPLAIIKIEGKEISISDYPNTIADQVRQIEVCAKKIEEAKKKGDSLTESSKRVEEMKVKWNNKKTSIEELQKAFGVQSEASESILEVVDASFSCMQKLSDATSFLFALGVSNMAANRIVIRELELKLKNAPKDELDKLAQEEIRNVLNQLKAQEIVFTRLERAEAKIKKINKETIPWVEKKVKDVDGKLTEKQNQFESKLEQTISMLQHSVNDLISTINNNQTSFAHLAKKQKNQAGWIIALAVIAVVSVLLHFVPII